MTFILRGCAYRTQAFGVILFGTSEGAMTVHRFDDKRYGKLISGRIINAFGCEYCYFTPTLEAAKLGGSKDVPTLNIIGTCDEYFGPPPDETFTYSQGYKKSQPEGAEFPTYGTPGACGTARRSAWSWPTACAVLPPPHQHRHAHACACHSQAHGTVPRRTRLQRTRAHQAMASSSPPATASRPSWRRA
jgi:ABC-type nickel/cobalt efflux system permease component RcnA